MASLEHIWGSVLCQRLVVEMDGILVLFFFEISFQFVRKLWQSAGSLLGFLALQWPSHRAPGTERSHPFRSTRLLGWLCTSCWWDPGPWLCRSASRLCQSPSSYRLHSPALFLSAPRGGAEERGLSTPNPDGKGSQRLGCHRHAQHTHPTMLREAGSPHPERSISC